MTVACRESSAFGQKAYCLNGRRSVLGRAVLALSGP
jgi:hypothetical protein